MTPEELKERHCETLERNIELAQDILKANAEVRRLQAESVEREAVLQTVLSEFKKYHHENTCEYSDSGECYCGFLKPTPPTGYAAKVLALAGAGYYWVNGHPDRDMGGAIDSDLDRELEQAAEALTPEDIKLLNGGM